MGAAQHQFDFSPNPAAGITVHSVGRHAEPVIVIDNVMSAPGALIDYATSRVAFAPCSPGGYPGVRASAPLPYVERLVRQLDPLIRRAFGIADAVLAEAECSFSIVTTPPHALLPSQRIPHVDTSYPLQFAVLHFLCDGDFGGTGFFRHDATSVEIVTGDDEARYVNARGAIQTMPPPGYISQHCPGYTCTGAFEAVFNRLLVYRSCRLHCGLIPASMPLVADPRRGRLTANIFASYGRP